MTRPDDSSEDIRQQAIEATPVIVAIALTIYSGLFARDWVMTVGGLFFITLSLDWAVNREIIRDTTRRLQKVADNAE